MAAKFVFAFLMVVAAVSAETFSSEQVLANTNPFVIPVDILNVNISELIPPTSQQGNERTLAFLYTSCSTTLTCTDTNYYCGFDILAPLAGYRCYPKKCFGGCMSGSECVTGACTLLFCQSCIGK